MRACPTGSARGLIRTNDGDQFLRRPAGGRAAGAAHAGGLAHFPAHLRAPVLAHFCLSLASPAVVRQTGQDSPLCANLKTWPGRPASALKIVRPSRDKPHTNSTHHFSHDTNLGGGPRRCRICRYQPPSLSRSPGNRADAHASYLAHWTRLASCQQAPAPAPSSPAQQPAALGGRDGGRRDEEKCQLIQTSPWARSFMRRRTLNDGPAQRYRRHQPPLPQPTANSPNTDAGAGLISRPAEPISPSAAGPAPPPCTAKSPRARLE
jgi:hypothetical protein